MSFPLLVEVAPSVPATDAGPSRGPEYKSVVHTAFEIDSSKTLFDTFEASCVKYAERPCIGYRPTDKNGEVGDYTFYTYKETNEKAQAFASSLKSAGITKGSKVAVFGANCCEWMITMQACNRMGYVCVPLYDTLGENAIEYIIDHSEAAFLVLQSTKLPAFAAALSKITATLLGVVYWGKDPSTDALSTIAAKGIKVTPFEEFLVAGAGVVQAADPPTPADLCTIMYTSGTTGDPKGVMLTHSSVVNVVNNLIVFLNSQKMTLGMEDRFLSYLPLAHIFDRTAEEMFLSFGGSIGYWQGVLPEMISDIAALKPTMFAGVPRVFERIHGRIKDRIASSGCFKSMLFNWAYKNKLARLNAGFSSASAAPFWDKLVFNKIKAQLGGCVRVIISGGAPLAPHVEEFLKVAMCSPVVQGYGLTETCAASMIANPDDIKMAGTVGPPQPCTTMTLESVPEMNYDATGNPPRGELLLKGPNNFSGYYKMDDKTVRPLMCLFHYDFMQPVLSRVSATRQLSPN